MAAESSNSNAQSVGGDLSLIPAHCPPKGIRISSKAYRDSAARGHSATPRASTSFARARRCFWSVPKGTSRLSPLRHAFEKSPGGLAEAFIRRLHSADVSKGECIWGSQYFEARH